MVIPKVFKKWDILFFILLIGISYLYSYNIILGMRPYSFHQWRQCDCLSFTLNYYRGGMHFFHPVLNSCGYSGNGMTCPSEFPILYYVVALLWKIFGYNESIYRLVEIIIGFSGLYALFLLIKELVQDGAWALMVSLLLFTSPIYAIYTNNFITDTPALSIALIAWYFFVKYYKTKRLVFYNFSILFFLLAGLLKPISLISFVPLVFIFLWELIRKSKNPEERIFIKPLKQSFVLIFLFLGIYAWLAYSSYYSKLHNPEFFNTTTHLGFHLAIWELKAKGIAYFLNNLYNSLLPQYFSFFIIFLSLVLFVVMLFNFKKMNRFYYWFIIMVFSGCILYMLLWFQVFNVHDYYLISVLIFVPATFVTFLVFLKESYPTIFKSIALKIAFAFILAANIYYCAIQINLRYPVGELSARDSFIVDKPTKDLWDWYHWDYSNNLKAFETITPYLRNLGISREDKVISLPEESPIISLYLMDQKGFTNFGCKLNYDDSNCYARNTDSIKKCIHLGAKYLMISKASFLEYKWLKPFLNDKIGVYKNVTIYDLRH